MPDQIDVEIMSQWRWHKFLGDIGKEFSAPTGPVNPSKAVHDSQTVDVGREYLATQRIHHYAACGLDTYARQASQIRFNIAVIHVSKRGQRRLAPIGLKALHNCLDVRGFLSRQSS